MGLYPDSPDARDYHFEYFAHVSLGHHVDLRHSGNLPPVYNQKTMGSCTAHAVAGAFEFEVQKQGLPDFSPSRLFIWYNARAKSSVLHATKKNVGSSIREAIKSLNFKEHGVCSESDWPYEVGKYNKKTRYFIDNAKAARKPPAIVEKHAHLHTAAKYRAICAPNLREKLIQCLDQGYPFVFGMHTYGLLSKVNKHGRGLRTSTIPTLTRLILTFIQTFRRPKIRRMAHRVMPSWQWATSKSKKCSSSATHGEPTGVRMATSICHTSTYCTVTTSGPSVSYMIAQPLGIMSGRERDAQVTAPRTIALLHSFRVTHCNA